MLEPIIDLIWSLINELLDASGKILQLLLGRYYSEELNGYVVANGLVLVFFGLALATKDFFVTGHRAS